MQPGQILVGRYEVQNFIGEGGMQHVFQCYDHALERVAVLKTPKAGAAVRRFKRGAAAGALVRHPNVAATFDYFEDPTLTFLVEEFVAGRDLAKRFAADFFYLDPSLAAHVVHHTARALAAAHRAGIAHRDLKPSNIMVSDDPGMSVLKLTDFGIAKLAQTELGAEIEKVGRGDSILTSSSTLLGAIPYLAPECWEDWSRAGQPMDIWALGCIAYEMLAGQPPFGSGAQAIAKVVRVVTDGVHISQPRWFGAHGATLPLEAELWDLISACLAPDPARRPTADQVLNRTAQLCYPDAPRRAGSIQSYGQPFAQTGWISDENQANTWFFHGGEYYGDVAPRVRARVSYAVYPGVPHYRASPVLLLKS